MRDSTRTFVVFAVLALGVALLVVLLVLTLTAFNQATDPTPSTTSPPTANIGQPLHVEAP